jgi:uncharacterized heparinase superfamily protein
MKNRVTKLEKLRGKSLRELRIRGAQELAKLNERVFGATELSDAELFRQIDPGSRNGNGEGSAMLILERIRSTTVGASPDELRFFPSLACRDEVSSIIKNRFPEERRALLELAERAIKGRFDLLGFADLSFGDPIDWHLEPTSGKRSPLVHWSKINYLDPTVAGDKKVTWELNRHGHFVTLGQAYWLTGDERFAEAFVAQASAWMNSNPPKLGINWASSLELAFRVIAWTWAIHLFADSDRLTPKFVTRFLKFLVAQGRHIERNLSHYFSPNTHLTGEALGLFCLGATMPEFARARRWRDTGLRVLLEQLTRHIRSDGTYFEQSSYYHRYTVDFYTHLLVLARAADIGLPRDVKDRLSLALDHLMFLTRPDGTSPLYGDDDGGRLLELNARAANDFRDTLATGAALFDRSDWKYVAGSAPIETLWLLGPQALANYDGLEAREPIETSRAFSEGGYVVMRDGWSDESSYALIDCGPHGSGSCAHAHADALAFEYAAEGRTWLIDPGTFTYTGDASLRDQFRASSTHNTVTVDGLPQSVAAGPFAWESAAASNLKTFVSSNAFDYFEGSHNGYARLTDPVTHTRSILFVKPDRERDLPSFMVVRDKFDAREQHAYALRYHFSPDCSASVDQNFVTAVDPAGLELLIKTSSRVETKAHIEDGWVSNCYGQRNSAAVALFEAKGHGPQEFVSFITSRKSCRGGPLWPPLVRETKSPCLQGGAATEGRPYMAFSMVTGRVCDLFMMAEGSGDITNEMSHSLLTAQGSMGWGRFIKGLLERGCLIGGTRFEVANLLSLFSPETVGCCAVHLDDGSGEITIQITIHGATRFDLSFDIPPGRIVVNKSRFDPLPGSRVFSFALAGSAWMLTQED